MTCDDRPSTTGFTSTQGIRTLGALVIRHAGDQLHRQRHRALRALRRLGVEEPALGGRYRQGLPLGLDRRELERTVRDVGGGRVASVKYRRLSNWKKTGAFRLITRTAEGRKVSFVFKSADYFDRDLCELNGVPLNLGLGEYTLLADPSPELSRFLPKVYRAVEVAPGKAYRYLMEDLSVTHRSFAGDRDRAALVGAIPELHRALAEMKERDGSNSLIRWDEAFALRILDHARRNLESYRSKGCDEAVDNLLRRWRGFERVYRDGVQLAYQAQPLQLIHGDCDPSNLLFERRGNGLKAIDFEWAGWGLPYHDLVSALRGASERTRSTFVEQFSAALGRRPLETDAEIYAHCRLQRELLNAFLLAPQWLRAETRSVAWTKRFVASSCRNVMRIARLT